MVKAVAPELRQAFSYRDVPHVRVMHKASLAMAKGADFDLPIAMGGILAAMGLLDRETVEQAVF